MSTNSLKLFIDEKKLVVFAFVSKLKIFLDLISKTKKQQKNELDHFDRLDFSIVKLVEFVRFFYNKIEIRFRLKWSWEKERKENMTKTIYKTFGPIDDENLLHRNRRRRRWSTDDVNETIDLDWYLLEYIFRRRRHDAIVKVRYGFLATNYEIADLLSSRPSERNLKKKRRVSISFAVAEKERTSKKNVPFIVPIDVQFVHYLFSWIQVTDDVTRETCDCRSRAEIFHHVPPVINLVVFTREKQSMKKKKKSHLFCFTVVESPIGCV